MYGSNVDTSSSMQNPSQNRIGVLTDTEVLLVDVVQGKQALRTNLLPVDGDKLSVLFEYLFQLGLSEVWVLPTSRLSQTAKCAWFEESNEAWMAVVHPKPFEQDRPICALLLPKLIGQRERRRLTIVFPEHAGWGWTIPDATSLLATVTYLDQTLERPVSDSPELVSHQLLTELVPEQPESRSRSSIIDSHILPIMENIRELEWMRPLTLVEQRQRYLHKYNHIALSLEACTAVKLGIGVPEFSSTGRDYDGICPGIWRVDIEPAGSIFDGKKLPYFIEDKWISTPQIKCCEDIGYRVYVREGYYWPQSFEPLKQWATTLWLAGERLHSQRLRHMQGKANAIHTIKLLAELGGNAVIKEKQDGGWDRYDWWVQIAGRSRAILFTHLARFARKGVMPVLLNRDAFWFVSNDPDPISIVPWIRATQRWRGYDAGYHVPLPLSNEVKAIFRSGESADKVARSLDALAGETHH
jgi:hypothetical protein